MALALVSVFVLPAWCVVLSGLLVVEESSLRSQENDEPCPEPEEEHGSSMHSTNSSLGGTLVGFGQS